MKNILKQTIFFSLCLLGGVTYGQSGTLYRASAMGVDNIVRYEPTSGKHIIYSTVAGNENHFLLEDMGILLDVRVADNLKVTDFEIIDGLVFFCGESVSGSGFLGWFDIDDLFYMGGTAHIDQTLSMLGLHTLDNIEVYYDTTGDIRIAGYGVQSNNAPFLTTYKAFEAVGTLATGMMYRTMDLRSGGLYGNVSDVAVTDHFVVYLSSDRNQVCSDHVGIGITLQPFPKYDMFGAPPFYYHGFQLSAMSALYAYSYVLPINNDPYNNPYNERVYPRMVHSFGDEVAVCTYRKDLDDSGWNVPPPTDPCGDSLPEKATYITHYLFDLSPLILSTNNQIQMTSRAQAKLYNGGVISIDGFEYEPQTHRYLVLHRHETSAGVYEHALTTVDFLSGSAPTFVESSYQVPFYTSSVWMPTDMCLDGYLDYTVIGHENLTSEYIIWHNSVASITHECRRMVQYPMTPRSLSPGKYFVWDAIPKTWVPLVFINQPAIGPVVFTCQKICY